MSTPNRIFTHNRNSTTPNTLTNNTNNHNSRPNIMVMITTLIIHSIIQRNHILTILTNNRTRTSTGMCTRTNKTCMCDRNSIGTINGDMARTTNTHRNIIRTINGNSRNIINTINTKRCRHGNNTNYVRRGRAITKCSARNCNTTSNNGNHTSRTTSNVSHSTVNIHINMNMASNVHVDCIQ